MSKSFQGPVGAVSRQGDGNDDLPPAYSAPTSPLIDDTIPSPSISSIAAQSGIPGLPNIPFSHYCPPVSSISSDKTTVTVNDAALITSARAFATFLREQTSLPPKIDVRIVGTHKSSHNGTDFDIRLSILSYFVPRGNRPGLNYVKILPEHDSKKQVKRPSASPRDIDDCARAFVSDKAWPRSFTVTRKIVNFDADYLRGVIHGLATSINYRGTVKVVFEHTHHKTVYQAPRPSNTSAFAAGLRSVFAAPKTFDVEAIWPYADKPVHEDDETGGVGRRMFVVRSERGWWQDWKGVVRDAMLTRKSARLGIEDYIDFMSDPAARERKVPSGWGEDAY